MEVALVIILGAIAPFLIALINKVKWSSTTKQLVAWGTSIVLSVVWLLLSGGVSMIANWQAFVGAVPVIYALSQAVYEFLLKNVLSKLEAATDKSAVVVTPAENPANVIVTSNETIQVANVSDANANVEVDAPIEIRTQNDVVG